MAGGGVVCCVRDVSDVSRGCVGVVLSNEGGEWEGNGERGLGK
jgi:hypothetical protein